MGKNIGLCGMFISECFSLDLLMSGVRIICAVGLYFNILICFGKIEFKAVNV